MITISIDVTKLDKSRFKQGNNGQTYCDLTLIDTPDSQYGDHFMIVQRTSKEEREAGTKLPILGNGKDWSREDNQQAPAQQQAPATNNTEDEADSLPF